MSDSKLQQIPPVEAAAVTHTGFGARIRNYFLTGLIVVGPTFVTAWLIWSFIHWVDGWVKPLVPPELRPETYLPINLPGTGLIIAFVALTLLGFLTANLIGRKLVDYGERILNRMPIVRPIYKTMKQIFETVFAQNGSSFRTVGLVEFPAPGMWSLVFLSQPPSADIAALLPESDHISVFLPCTPNPTTGFFFYLPRKDVIELDIKVEEAMTLLISAGMIQPGGGDQQKKFAAMAQTARAASAARIARTPETAK